jgi:hypothetical protein
MKACPESYPNVGEHLLPAFASGFTPTSVVSTTIGMATVEMSSTTARFAVSTRDRECLQADCVCKREQQECRDQGRAQPQPACDQRDKGTGERC